VGGGYLDIVKKGYARGVDSRQRSTSVSACRAGPATPVVDAGSVQRDRRLANRKLSVRVYLDATGLSMAMFTVPRRSRTGLAPSKRGVSAGFLRWALLMRAIK
jgi:hypothetical protein